MSQGRLILWFESLRSLAVSRCSSRLLALSFRSVCHSGEFGRSHPLSPNLRTNNASESAAVAAFRKQKISAQPRSFFGRKPCNRSEFDSNFKRGPSERRRFGVSFPRERGSDPNPALPIDPLRTVQYPSESVLYTTTGIDDFTFHMMGSLIGYDRAGCAWHLRLYLSLFFSLFRCSGSAN